MSGNFTGWRTPKELFDLITFSVGGFAVDAAADSSNALVGNYYGPGSPLGEDALQVSEWLSPAWCNPPYGKGIEAWLRKFIAEQETGGTVVALLPARIETRWWFELVVPYADILFLVGRVPFIRGCDKCPADATHRAKIEGGMYWYACSDHAEEQGAEPFSTQPDHASALCFYMPTSSGRVDWLDWKNPKRDYFDAVSEQVEEASSDAA